MEVYLCTLYIETLIFRIFDVLEPEEAVQSIFLGDKNSQEELGTFSHATLNTTGSTEYSDSMS